MASLAIQISSSILRSLMYTDLILLICVHHHRPVFNIVFCYSALHLLRDYEPSFCAQHVLYNPESPIDWSRGAILVHACLCVCVCPLLIYSLTIAPPAVSCGPLCWEESITFSLACLSAVSLPGERSVALHQLTCLCMLHWMHTDKAGCLLNAQISEF